MLNNFIVYIIIPIFVGIVAYIFKLFIDIIFNKFSIKGNSVIKILFDRSGGFPSVHATLVSSISVLIGLVEGFNSLIFAVVFVISFLFCYDATGVRFQVGKQGKMLNMILKKNNIDNNKLNERVGHTIVEVIGGAIIGGILTYLMFTFNLF